MKNTNSLSYKTVATDVENKENDNNDCDNSKETNKDEDKTKLLNIILLGIVFMTAGSRYHKYLVFRGYF